MVVRIRQFFGPRGVGNSILTARLLEALARPGCPLCRVLATTTRHHLEALLDERVVLPNAHRDFRASRGFCGEHTWAIPPAALAAQSARGAAILYAPLLADLLDRWPDPDQRRRWLVPMRRCTLCVLLAGTTTAYLAEYTNLLQQGVASALAAVPCLPHLGVLTAYGDSSTRAHLAAASARARDAATLSDRVALSVGYRPVDPFPVAPACPVCAAATEAALETRAAVGLCRAHAWAQFAAGRTVGDAGVSAPDSIGDCPACRAAATAAAVALDRHQPTHRLCLAHLWQASECAWLDPTVAFWSLSQLERDLVRYIASGSATFTGTLTADERRSWLVALARFGGETPNAALTAAVPWFAHSAQPSAWRAIIH
jgi:hypothetical protein